MITPTIGRKIWFWPNQTNTACYTVLDAAQAFDASVVFVAADDRVHIAFFDHTGVPFIRHDVPILQDDKPLPAGTCYCAWMPYQQSAVGVAPMAVKKAADKSTPKPTK